MNARAALIALLLASALMATGCEDEAPRLPAPGAPGSVIRVPAPARPEGELVGVAPPALPEAPAPPPSAVLEQIALYGAPGERKGAQREVRVVLRFDREAVYRRSELPAGGGLPRRLVLDLDGVTIAEPLQHAIPVDRGGLARIRAFALDEERARVSFDVGANTAHRLFAFSDPFRVVMDFRSDVPPASRGREPAFTVVLDPGHGGEQPGAKGPNGLRESHVALALARRVRNALRQRVPEARVVMTRDEDRFVTLEERAAIANAVDADLFVSIHLNASHVPDDLGGVATFVLDTTDDQAALRLAARENDTDIEGVSRLQLILASLFRRDQVDRSRALADRVQRATLRSGRRVLPELNDRGVKSALFYVLVGAQMPAILVEASFITEPREAAALATDEYRQALADGIAEGIVQHLHPPRGGGG